jgi:hypothetical protein
LAKILREKSADEAAEQISGLEKSHPLYPKIVETIKKGAGGKEVVYKGFLKGGGGDDASLKRCKHSQEILIGILPYLLTT